MAIPPKEDISLKRTLGPVMVTCYGLGTIIGAGIYVLLGSVAGLAGNWLPFSFLLAGVIAAFTALSYAELSSRLPQCAGAAIYVHEAWWNKGLSTLVGWMLVLTGIVSAAAIANGFVGYLNVFISIEAALAISILVLTLGFIAAWDMQASAMMITIVTLIEVGGLMLVVAFAAGAEPVVTTAVNAPAVINGTVAGVILGGFIAFYAFIGFEDMVNIVEEVKEPERNMPLGIIVSVTLAIGLYFMVALAALHVMSASELAQSEAPLADMMLASGGDTLLITLISLVAVINGALVQIIMASRVLYGMAGKEMAPAILGSLNPQTRTPVVATALVASLVLLFALALPLEDLARLTSFIMLVIFILVNSALVVIKRRSYQYYAGINLPVAVPVIGGITALLLVLYQSISYLSN
jgi:basic amino acid/polyamine antiporter, APA family